MADYTQELTGYNKHTLLAHILVQVCTKYCSKIIITLKPTYPSQGQWQGEIIMPIAQIRKLQLREVSYPQDGAASEQLSYGLNPRSLPPPLLLPSRAQWQRMGP